MPWSVCVCLGYQGQPSCPETFCELGSPWLSAAVIVHAVLVFPVRLLSLTQATVPWAGPLSFMHLELMVDDTVHTQSFSYVKEVKSDVT